MKDIEYEELAIEIMDMLAVALHFAGAKEECIEKLIDLYILAVEQNENDKEYNQQAMIAIIKNLKTKNPNFFHNA
ncbi:hypothetical protein [Helicobacter mustelae]|uniref:Uncharacterized protein n=1 Tax=Helicobacter mustelae (strain ATCC 43772 / CCUG 25715 / CIP 103759 / LMG 18044 / NCTC 12198 / R85-136P) TaxID=679897 RepID=D3UH13_HELM1|nr:hypothetical protein [Helicobacter mustelae]CBG39785.1 Putative hypothetical protein [Helicobacter mustelae 12198]SQH71294.1 Uncharacterised protein [Helicobacter mustelae]STP12419.1 Uncharacterised protein [Helicobacter mustelae]